MARRMFLLPLLCALASPAAAQQGEQRAGLDWLVGSWKGGGTHGGRPSEASLDVRPAIGGKFLELRYRVEVRPPLPFTFEGRAFYRPGDGNGWKGDWFDSRGMVLPIAATATAETLTSDWGNARTERGRTLYRLLGDGRFEVTDTVVARDGTSREFARQTLSRAR